MSFYFRLYFKFICIYIKAKIEYRFAFFMDVFCNAFTYIVSYLGIWIIVGKFQQINGWSYYEVFFLYSLNLISYTIASLFVWAPMRNLEGMVQTGEFDSILTKPINPFFHMIFRGFQYTFFGHLIIGTIVLIISIINLNIEWSVLRIAYFILVMCGAILMQAGIMIIIASTGFWIVKYNTLFDIILYNIRNFINYPIDIYDKWVRGLLTFLIPYAFVNFIPTLFLLKRIDSSVSHNIIYFGTPFVGVIIFILAYSLWNRGIRHYQSTGS